MNSTPLNTVLASLNGQHQMLIRQRDDHIANYQRVTHRVQIAEKAKKHFFELKEFVDQDIVRVYGELLTSIVTDVMQAHGQSVVLNTDVIRGKTTLDLTTIKDGYTESLIDGRGGSISNLVAAGLRFISLYKSSNRRFLLLDEPECWVESHLIPRFVSVIEKLCDMIGIQVLLISHHASDVVSSNQSKIITLTTDRNGVLKAEHKSVTVVQYTGSIKSIDDPYAEFTEGVGIRSLRLKNAQSHIDTFITLSPGLTVVNGANDVGKSAVARIFRAFLRNDFRAEYVHHKHDILTFEITLEQQSRVVWTYSRTSKLAIYQLFTDDRLILEEEAVHGAVPQFVDEMICMPLVHGLDIHIADQKDTLYLLHPAVSPSQRADLLNLGAEFKRLQTMMKIHDVMVRDDRAELKLIKKMVDEANHGLHFFEPLSVVNDAMSALNNEHDVEDINPLIALLSDLESSATTLMYDEALSLSRTILTSMNSLQLFEEHNDIYDTLSAASHPTDPHVLELIAGLTKDLLIIEPVSESQLGYAESYLSASKGVVDSEHQIEMLVLQLETLQVLKVKFTACPTCGQRLNHDLDDSFSELHQHEVFEGAYE